MIMMGLELMLNGAILAAVAFWAVSAGGTPKGQLLAIVRMTVMAVESGDRLRARRQRVPHPQGRHHREARGAARMMLSLPAASAVRRGRGAPGRTPPGGAAVACAGSAPIEMLSRACIRSSCGFRRSC